jgi:hypothetical protein
MCPICGAPSCAISGTSCLSVIVLIPRSRDLLGIQQPRALGQRDQFLELLLRAEANAQLCASTRERHAGSTGADTELLGELSVIAALGCARERAQAGFVALAQQRVDAPQILACIEQRSPVGIAVLDLSMQLRLVLDHAMPHAGQLAPDGIVGRVQRPVDRLLWLRAGVYFVQQLEQRVLGDVVDLALAVEVAAHMRTQDSPKRLGDRRVAVAQPGGVWRGSVQPGDDITVHARAAATIAAGLHERPGIGQGDLPTTEASPCEHVGSNMPRRHGSTPLVSLPPTRSALAAPFVVVGQELRQIASQPGPFFGGLLGTIMSCAALCGALLWMPSPAAAKPEPVFTIDFIPASAMPLGELDGETDAVATSEPAIEAPVSEPGPSVSDAATTPSPKPKPNPSPSPNPKPSPNPNPDPDLGGANPFGDPNAWSDLVGDGDPWAAAVMAELRSMKVPAWAGKIATDRPFAFRLIICKDGRIDQVLRKQSTGDVDLDATLEHEISRLVLPRVPASMAAAMPRSCVMLNYQFTWSASGVG